MVLPRASWRLDAYAGVRTSPPKRVTERQLQRDPALERSIGAFGKPDRAHATLAERAQQAIRPDLLAFRTAGHRHGRLLFQLGKRPQKVIAPRTIARPYRVQ